MNNKENTVQMKKEGGSKSKVKDEISDRKILKPIRKYSEKENEIGTFTLSNKLSGLDLTPNKNEV
jgi:hypothetical protein